MNRLLQPGSGILFMKVGTHAQESLQDIIARKTREIEEAGYALWGYGGGTCHPKTMVQPFANTFEKKGGTIYLCMQEMDSRHFAQQLRAAEFSVDGEKWEKIPRAVNVLGSRYALAIRGLRQEALSLPLSQTRVAVGNSRGRPGHKYVLGRVDKACLEVVGKTEPGEEDHPIEIGLVAELIKPYAVFVR